MIDLLAPEVAIWPWHFQQLEANVEKAACGEKVVCMVEACADEVLLDPKAPTMVVAVAAILALEAREAQFVQSLESGARA